MALSGSQLTRISAYGVPMMAHPFMTSVVEYIAAACRKLLVAIDLRTVFVKRRPN